MEMGRDERGKSLKPKARIKTHMYKISKDICSKPHNMKFAMKYCKTGRGSTAVYIPFKNIPKLLKRFP